MNKYLYQDLYDLEDKHWWHISKRNILFRLVDKYVHKKSPKILDIGCGTGKNLEALQDIGKAYGLDNSKKAISFCKKRGLKNLKLGDAENTKYPNAFFDVVIALDVIEHTEDKNISKEIYRILKKNGIVIITVPANQWLWSRWDVVLHHKRRYTKKSLTNLLKKHNFEVLKISYMYSFLVLPALIIRKIKEKFSRTHYSSDFKLSSPLINWFFLRVAKLESLLTINGYIPIGTSLICVAQKNGR